jgi:hypothetical protein
VTLKEKVRKKKLHKKMEHNQMKAVKCGCLYLYFNMIPSYAYSNVHAILVVGVKHPKKDNSDAGFSGDSDYESTIPIIHQ